MSPKQSKSDVAAKKQQQTEHSAKQLGMMAEEENNNNNNSSSTNHNNNDNNGLKQSGYLKAERPASRGSSSALSSGSCASSDELHLSSSVGEAPSTSGAEDTGSPGSSPSPELQQTASGALVKRLNVHANLIAENERVHRIVDSIRLRFLDLLHQLQQDEPTKAAQLYEESDLDELRAELPPPQRHEQSLAFRLISRFYHVSQYNNQSIEFGDKEFQEGAEKLSELLQLRCQFRVPHIRPDQFCQEFFQMHGIFPFGVDRTGLPVLYLRAQVHRRWSHKLDETFRRYVVWQIDLITKSYAGAQVQKSAGWSGIEKDGSFGICFDCLHVSYSCVDMDFLRFLVRLLVHCYPTYCRYALCVDLPWLFRSVWKLVRSWLPDEAQNGVQLITSKQLTDYIDPEQIPNSIKISDNHSETVSEKRKHKLPENFDSIRSFDEFARELELNSNEVKAFKCHIDKVLKEYRNLGAI